MLLRAISPFREALQKEIGRCELCLRGKPALHELTQGYGRRVQALAERGLILGLCWKCHHRVHSMGLRGKLLCLALLKIRRPADYNLGLFWEVNGRRWPDAEEVAEFEKQVIKGMYDDR